MTLKIDPKTITGPWLEGFTLDRHTISSVPIGTTPGGRTQFQTTRTELGELVYQLKYGGKKDPLPTITAVAEAFVRERWGVTFDCVVPTPPSVSRKLQPVVQVARALATKLGIRTCEDAVEKVKPTTQMKNIAKFVERQKVLGDAIQKGDGDVKGKRILLVDDLAESGSTLRRTAEVLWKDGKAASIHALVLTRTK